MEPTMSKAESSKERPDIDMVEFGRDLLRRRAEYEAVTGKPLEISRNSGKRRTASKRALLEEIEKAGGRW
jgi:hypothetical protein